MTLVPPAAPFLQDSDLVLAADCVPFAYPGFHADFLKDHSLLVACPKLDDAQAHLNKLTEILKQSSIKNLKVVHMEVPCCHGLVRAVAQAILNTGLNIPLRVFEIGVKGNIKAVT